MIQAHVDERRTEKKGFIQHLAVLPGYRNRGIAKELLRTAIASLKEGGMKIASAWTQTDRPVCIHIYETFGFKHARSSTLMKRLFADCLEETAKDSTIGLREARLNDHDEIVLFNHLDNEAFKEHFNYRPMTIEETRYSLLKSPFWKSQKAWSATLDDLAVRHIVIGVDERLNKEKNTKQGWILNVGVLKPYRRRAIGTKLMLHAMSYLKTAGLEDALLYVDDQNPTHAIKLYEKVGFQPYRKTVSYELQLI